MKQKGVGTSAVVAIIVIITIAVPVWYFFFREAEIRPEDLLSGPKEASNGFVTFRINSVEVTKFDLSETNIYGDYKGTLAIYSVTIKNEENPKIYFHQTDITFEGDSVVHFGPLFDNFLEYPFPKDGVELSLREEAIGQVGAIVQGEIDDLLGTRTYHRPTSAVFSYALYSENIGISGGYTRYHTQGELVIPLP